MSSVKKADSSICMTFSMVKIALWPHFSPLLCSKSCIILSLSECAYPLPTTTTAAAFSFPYSHLTKRKGPCDAALIFAENARELANACSQKPSILFPFPLLGSFDHHSSAQNKRKVVYEPNIDGAASSKVGTCRLRSLMEDLKARSVQLYISRCSHHSHFCPIFLSLQMQLSIP